MGGESFYTTVVKNVHSTLPGDVMMAPADPGGIQLHKLTGNPDDELLLTSGAYVASDATVNIGTAVQTQWSNSLLSGTGFFLLRASGRGIVACAAYGSIHKYELREGESRSVDNGHLVAWSANLPYRVGLASRGGIMASMKSGEGLMCHFGPGPGTIYLQSHKPGEAETAVKHSKRAAKGAAQVGVAYFVLIPFILVSVVILVTVVTMLIAHLKSIEMDPTTTYYDNNNDDYYHGNKRKAASSRRTVPRGGYMAVGEL
ncbi:Pfam:DUF124 [Seminavis robusta]|uniref:Pfam:DUF124 n=1 Tax=Seminavis robusta TaxID=568900 RepID=A0A9N8EZE1_9STRA|nr:Pfam:DUF124 [Seminavis robusta]|eukprot:Sro2010_g310770.1 Pfam:DUF124 (258) ;mRNA; r:952-1725